MPQEALVDALGSAGSGAASGAALGGPWGAVIGGGLGLLGGFVSRSGAKAAAAQQEEFAKHGVSWRVADAKAAGLHPLFALGAQIQQPAAINVGAPLGEALGNMGQEVSRSIAAQETEDQKAARALQMRLILSQIGESDARAGYYHSLARRTLGGDQVAPGIGSSGVAGPDVPPNVVGKIAPKPDEVIAPRADDPGVSAGRHTGFMEVVLPKNASGRGMMMMLPRSDSGSPWEAYSEMSWYDKLIVAQVNAAKYGSVWLKDFATYLAGGMPGIDTEPGTGRPIDRDTGRVWIPNSRQRR